jgi:hypothetical protein
MKVGVYGSASGNISEQARIKAAQLGVALAKNGCTVVTGACFGLPYEAVLMACRLGARCIGYSPAVDMQEHVSLYGYPVRGFDELVFIPRDFEYAGHPQVCKKYRNIRSVFAVDAAIFVGGSTGTMNEFTLAFDFGKPIGVLTRTGGITERAIEELMKVSVHKARATVLHHSDPHKLVDELVNTLRSKR